MTPRSRRATERHHAAPAPGTRAGAFVLGTHRSGTSACAALIALLGVPTCCPGDLYAPLDGNERGHWESATLQAANDRLLAQLGRSWWCPPTGREELIESPRAIPELERAFRSSHPTSQWVWKDPRLCLTLPFWRAALSEPVVAVLVFRHPLEVAASLEARNGFGREVSLALWERYNRLALRHVAGLPVLVTEFGAVTADPVGWCAEARAFLADHGLDVSGLDPERAGTFVERRLQHHRHSGAAPNDAPDLSAAQRALYNLLRESVGQTASFEPPALEAEDPEVEACLVDSGRPYGLPALEPIASQP
jgi:hypothetical protein